MTVNTQKLREAAEAFKQACEEGLFETEFGTWQALSHEFDQQVSHTVVIALLDEIDALRAELQARQWMPIETAPHETLVVLGWHDENGVFKQEIALASAGTRYPGGGSDMWWHGSATHWMPLPPDPPKGETA